MQIKPSVKSALWKSRRSGVHGRVHSIAELWISCRSINWAESNDLSDRLEAISRNGLYIKSIKSQFNLIRNWQESGKFIKMENISLDSCSP